MRVSNGLPHVVRRRDVPEQSACDLVLLPGADELDECGLVEAFVQDLRDLVKLGDDHGLQDDADGGGEEELYVDHVHVTRVLLADELDVGRQVLQVHQHQEHEECPEQLRQVEAVLASEGLHDRLPYRVLCEQEVDQRDEGALELHPELRGHRHWAEGEPEDRLGGVGDDEQGNSRAESISFAEEIVKQDDDDSCAHQLRDYQRHRGNAHLRGLSVRSVPDGSCDFSEAEDERKHALERTGIPLIRLGVDLHESDCHQDLSDPAGGDDGRDAELHQRAPARCHDYPGPVERIRVVRAFDAVNGDLAADEVDQQGNCGEHGALLHVEGCGRFGHLREDASEGPQHVEHIEHAISNQFGAPRNRLTKRIIPYCLAFHSIP